VDPSEIAFFTRDGDLLVPTDLARSGWGNDHVHGVAISGALGREVERAAARLGRDDLRPARYTVDLFKAPKMVPCSLESRVVRDAPRICLVEVVLSQDGTAVARASAILLKPTHSAEGQVWEPDERVGPPPEDVAPPTDEPRVPFLHSEVGWSQKFGEHQNASRKTSWNSAVSVVQGEHLTPFQAVAATADGASLVTNWGTNGVEYINTDITLSLAREVVGVEIGLHALDRVESDGIAVGTAAVFDRHGPLGNVMVTSIVNARRTVDFSDVEYDDDGTRRGFNND
jgi:acyl-CoA thioesterase superfamily protein/acyl-Coa thioesterase superfamily protein